MFKKYLKSFILLTCLTLTSCSGELNEIFNGDEYNNPTFKENYYRERPDELKDENKIIKQDEIILSEGDFFRSYEEDDLFYLDENIYSTAYTSYGDLYKLSNVDESFKYGYLSKLYDGEMFCNGRFQLSRVQVDEDGFATLFNKEIYTYDYFAMNFKCAANFDDNTPIGSHSSHIELTISFYIRNGINFIEVPIVIDTDDIPTNAVETNSPRTYIFLTFDLHNSSFRNIDFTRLCGYSISYEYISDEVLDNNKDKESEYALMLYEVLFPNSTWL